MTRAQAMKPMAYRGVFAGRHFPMTKACPVPELCLVVHFVRGRGMPWLPRGLAIPPPKGVSWHRECRRMACRRQGGDKSMHEMSLAEGIRQIVEDAGRRQGFRKVRTHLVAVWRSSPKAGEKSGLVFVTEMGLNVPILRRIGQMRNLRHDA